VKSYRSGPPFLANGAIGFRYAAVRNRLGSPKTDAQRPIYVSAIRYAASLGLLGTLIQIVPVFRLLGCLQPLV